MLLKISKWFRGFLWRTIREAVNCGFCRTIKMWWPLVQTDGERAGALPLLWLPWWGRRWNAWWETAIVSKAKWDWIIIQEVASTLSAYLQVMNSGGLAVHIGRAIIPPSATFFCAASKRPGDWLVRSSAKRKNSLISVDLHTYEYFLNKL